MALKNTFAALIALAPALFASAAKADILDFSYTWSPGDVLSGTMDGTLLSDGNDFDVSSFGSFFLNGVAVPLPDSKPVESIPGTISLLIAIPDPGHDHTQAKDRIPEIRCGIACLIHQLLVRPDARTMATR